MTETDAQSPVAALARFQLSRCGLRPIAPNHWRVRHATGDFCLKRYPAAWADQAGFGLRVQEQLHADGVPVPAVRQTPDGASVVVHAQHAYSLQAFCPGPLVAQRRRAARRHAGRLLAALQRAMAPLAPAGDVGRAFRLADPDTAVGRLQSLQDQAAACPCPRVRTLVLEEISFRLQLMEQMAPFPLPERRQLLHRDFHPANVIIVPNGPLTTIDFDYCGTDYVALEFGRALVTFGWTERTLDPSLVREFAAGYLSTAPRAPAELRWGPRMWLRYLAQSVWPLAELLAAAGTEGRALWEAHAAERRRYSEWLHGNLEALEQWLMREMAAPTSRLQ